VDLSLDEAHLRVEDDLFNDVLLTKVLHFFLLRPFFVFESTGKFNDVVFSVVGVTVETVFLKSFINLFKLLL